MQVPCGTCAECQSTLSNQWYYRAYYEWFDLSKSNGYVLFDCLTYDEENLPHLSDFWSFIDQNNDYPCFDHSHIRKFLQLLRTRLIRAGYSKQSFRYFLSTEYGSSPFHTHRPHIHILLYVHDARINPLWLSRVISDVWKYGRTDGVKYKGSKYVLTKTYIPSSAPLDSKLRTCRYVTKYVQKCCEFQSQLDWRIRKVMWSMANFADPVSPENWLVSELAHREKLKLLRYVNQFHRQSQHFGESALEDIDLIQLYRDGCLYMPDTKGLMIPVPLPMYYKRKMFYEQIEFNGSRYWQITELGKEYNEQRKLYSRQRLIDRYTCLVHQYHLPIEDVGRLVDYVQDVRGTIRGELGSSTLSERIDSISFINYSTCSDKLNFGCRGLTEYWFGDSQQGYKTRHMFGRVTLSSFIQKWCNFDPQLEKELDIILSVMHNVADKKQLAYSEKQRLTNLYKYFNKV